MATVPLNAPGQALSAQRAELLAITARVIDSGWLIHGPEHRAFESELATFLGTTFALGVASGTDALEIALRAVHDDDDRRRTVITVANAGGYTSTAARAAGFEVAYCDVDPASHCLNPAALESVLDDSVFAVVVTHLYGRAADVGAVRALCEPRGIKVIEDCAQSIGARTQQGRAGSLGDIATFSFYPTKNLGALGDGGAIATSDSALGERVGLLRQYGWSSKYRITTQGARNSRLDEVQAAVLRFRLPLVDDWNERRRWIIRQYADAASDRIHVLEAGGPWHSAHLAVVETSDAAELARHLERRDVQTAVHYPIPDHLQRAFATTPPARLPVTENLVGRILSLPCFPELEDAEVGQVCAALASY